jgi:hypothetical protein
MARLSKAIGVFVDALKEKESGSSAVAGGLQLADGGDHGLGTLLRFAECLDWWTVQMVALGDASPHKRGYRSPGHGGLHVGKADQACREASNVLDRDLPGTQPSTTRGEIHARGVGVQSLRDALDRRLEQRPQAAGQEALLEYGQAALGGGPRYS